jgi:hypothetical protein
VKLVLKQPKGKLPFIGVRYWDIYNAHYHNQDLVDKGLYTLTIKFKNILYHNGKPSDPHKETHYLELHLNSYDKRYHRCYTVDYNVKEFKEWYEVTRSLMHFNFGQVYELNGIDTIVMRQDAKPFVVKIQGLFLEGEIP